MTRGKHFQEQNNHMQPSIKYYYLRYKYLESEKYSIGDNAQSIAVKYVLGKLGVPEENVLPISRDHLALKHPNMDTGIVIAQGWFGLSPLTNPLPILHSNIHPIYFGFYLNEGSWEFLSKDELFIKSMKKYEPIGCRDFGLRDFLRSLGIKAYFSGCLTMTFEKRKNSPLEEKTFLVDALKEVEEFIPDKLRSNCVTLSQEGSFPTGIYPVCDEDVERIDKMACERLQQLKSEATFVITGRIHTAMPCVAMGIPVVFTFSQLDNPRVSIIKNYLPMYDEKTCHTIDWNHPAPDTEKLKSEMMLMFSYQLQKLENKLGVEAKRLSDEDAKKAELLIETACSDETSPIAKHSVKNYCKDDFLGSLFDNGKIASLKGKVPFVLFGAGSAGKNLSAIMQYFGIQPDFVCDNSAVEDNRGLCHGVPVITFNTLRSRYKKSIVFITTIKGLEPVYDQLIENGFENELIIKKPSLIQKYAHFLVPSNEPIRS